MVKAYLGTKERPTGCKILKMYVEKIAKAFKRTGAAKRLEKRIVDA
jgi:hypothetical protein